jgi:hypothetical protein
VRLRYPGAVFAVSDRYELSDKGNKNEATWTLTKVPFLGKLMGSNKKTKPKERKT